MRSLLLSKIKKRNGDPIAVGGDVLRRLMNVSCNDVSVTIDVEALTVGVRYSLPAVWDTGYRRTILTLRQ
jgi:hypothetical protein